MRIIYKKSGMLFIAAIAMSSVVRAQNTVRTITIVNGDTTLSETIVGDKEASDIAGKRRPEEKVIVRKKTEGDGAVADRGKEELRIEKRITIIENEKERMEDVRSDRRKDDRIVEVEREMSSDRKADGKGLKISVEVKDRTLKLSIESSDKEPVYISLLDSQGKQILYEVQKDNSNYSKEQKLEKGSYFLNVIKDKKTSQEKIEIQ
jgi:hypothetical protein